MAAVPFVFDCGVSSGFVMDPNDHQRVGWVIKLDGFGLPAGGLTADLKVSNPVTAGDVKSVIGVIEKFSWAGGAGDPPQLAIAPPVNQVYTLKLASSSAKTAAKAWGLV